MGNLLFIGNSTVEVSDSAATIKIKYESNPDTNAYTDAEKAQIAATTAIFTSALKIAYDSAVADAHTHGNKATLDLITEAFTTALKTSYDQAVTDSHTHGNKPTLDLITEAFTTALKASYDSAVADAHTHGNKPALDLVSGTNTGDEPIATYLVEGIALKSTTAKVIAETDDDSFITPLDLANKTYGVFTGSTPNNSKLKPIIQALGTATDLNTAKVSNIVTVNDKVQVRRTTSFAVPNGTPIDVPFDSTEIESNSLVIEHDSVNAERINIFSTEYHICFVNIVLTSLSAQPRIITLELYLNGTTLLNSVDFNSSEAPVTRTLIIPPLTFGDYLSIRLGSSGNGITLNTGAVVQLIQSK